MIMMLDISISDLALLDKDDFKTVWDALGKIVQAKIVQAKGESPSEISNSETKKHDPLFTE